jgi:hypothetical protein
MRSAHWAGASRVLFCPPTVDFARAYERVAGFLEPRGVPLAVVGGLGLHAYGITRATFDLDVVTEAAAQGPLVGFLEAEGYETLHCSAHYSNHLHRDAEGGRLDFIYVDASTSRQLFAAAQPLLELGSRRALVPRPEHLVAMKVQAIRNDPSRALQDLADVLALLRLPDVDVAQARGYFERAGLREEWDEVRRRL